jgi:hypothetical protein
MKAGPAPLDELIGNRRSEADGSCIGEDVDVYMCDLETPEEEAYHMMVKINQFFCFADIESGRMRLGDLGGKMDRLARIRAIRNIVGIHPDGSLEPLSWYQRCSYRNPRDRLEKKIMRVREQVRDLGYRINNLGDETEHKDITLVQQYVLDCLSPMKRFVLRHYFFEFDDVPPEEVRG